MAHAIIASFWHNSLEPNLFFWCFAMGVSLHGRVPCTEPLPLVSFLRRPMHTPWLQSFGSVIPQTNTKLLKHYRLGSDFTSFFFLALLILANYQAFRFPGNTSISLCVITSPQGGLHRPGPMPWLYAYAGFSCDMEFGASNASWVDPVAKRITDSFESGSLKKASMIYQTSVAIHQLCRCLVHVELLLKLCLGNRLAIFRSFDSLGRRANAIANFFFLQFFDANRPTPNNFVAQQNKVKRPICCMSSTDVINMINARVTA